MGRDLGVRSKIGVRLNMRMKPRMCIKRMYLKYCRMLLAKNLSYYTGRFWHLKSKQ